MTFIPASRRGAFCHGFVKGKKGESTCEVSADTKIAAEGEAKTLADVKVGDRAICKYVEKDGKRVCKSLKVRKRRD